MVVPCLGPGAPVVGVPVGAVNDPACEVVTKGKLFPTREGFVGRVCDMSEDVHGEGEVPQTGAVRINREGRVEHYDGATWRPYGELPDDGDLSEPRFRFHDDIGPPPP